MPFVLRLLRCVVRFPCSELVEVIGQHTKTPFFFCFKFLLGCGFSCLWQNRRLAVSVISKGKIGSYHLGGFFCTFAEKPCDKVNRISIRTATETMKTLIHFHARCAVIVKRTRYHSGSVHAETIKLCNLSCRNKLLYRFKYIQWAYLQKFSVSKV